MKYENVQKLRTKYRQDPEVINVEYMRDVAVRCGNFKKAFELQEKLEDIWFNYLKGVPGRAVDRYKMKKKTDKIKVGQRYEHKNYFENPFERGKHVIKILDIKEGYVLYEYEEKSYIRSSASLEDIVKEYILITDVKHK